MICPTKGVLIADDKLVKYSLSGTDFTFTIHHSIDEICDEWDIYRKNYNLFLSSAYFRALEECPPDDLRQRYILLRKDEELIALFPFQLKLFKASASILNAEASSNLRKSVAKHVQFNTLISGNITVSGHYLNCFLTDRFSLQEQYQLTEKVQDVYRRILKDSGTKVNMCFIKDIPKADSFTDIGARCSQFREFQVEPMMIFRINSAWKSMEDYLQSLTSKYRVRAKRAFKKAKGITFREIGLEEIAANRDVFYSLYTDVLKNISFSLFHLSPDYFYTLKKHLGDDFRFFVAESGDDGICAFYTLIHNDDELHAHYLGYKKEINRESQIYLNLLYKMIDLGINSEHSTIDFGRTALEIKSSVGAIGHEYSLFIKHKNPLANFFVPKLISILNKKTEWKPRSPFK